MEGDQARLTPMGHGVSRAQALYRAHARQPRTMDEFLEERHADAVGAAGGTESGE